MPFCPECGAPTTVGDPYCGECGAWQDTQIKNTGMQAQPARTGVISMSASGNTPTGIQLAPGTLLVDRYKITRRIGGGGMGSVYLAEDLNLASRPVAVKEMIEMFADESARVKAIEDFKRDHRRAEESRRSRQGHREREPECPAQHLSRSAGIGTGSGEEAVHHGGGELLA